MRVNICLLALVLGCNVTAEIIHEIIRQNAQASLRCPHSVEGRVTWSRERDGNIVDILTVDGDREIRHNDPGRRYGSLADKSLIIQKANVSDSGRYLCNNETAVELTVIPPGTIIHNATEGTRVNLTCPHVRGSGISTWSRRDIDDVQQKKGFYVSPLDNSLSISGVQLGDSGLYYCDGKPTAYLNVTKDNKKTVSKAQTTPETPTMPTTGTTTSTGHAEALGLVFRIVVSFLLLLLVLTIIVVVYFTRRWFQRQGSEEGCPVYDEIQDGIVSQHTYGRRDLNGQTTTYCMAEFPTQSNQHDPTYSTIPDPLPEEKTETFLHDESPYALIGNTFMGGNNKGSSQQSDNTYVLLEKPKATENNNDKHL